MAEAIYQSPSKTESRLTVTKTAGEKVSVLAHGRPAVLPIRMSKHNPQRKRDFGSTARETPVYGNIVNAVTMLTEGVAA